MSFRLSLVTLAIVLGLMPLELLAGGPPRLCLPVDGVTADNADECAARLASALKDKLWTHPDTPTGVQIHHSDKQSYLTCYMEQPMALSDIETALKGSEFSIPKDKLRLFGHVELQIDPRSASADELIAELAKINHVSVAESRRDKELLVTVDMPYPALNTRHFEWNPTDEVEFRRDDFASDQAARSEPPATSRSLPSYGAIGQVLARHHAHLTDLRWSTSWRCRVLGGVAAKETRTARAP